MSVTTPASAGAAGIRPFAVETPEADLEALRHRLAETRWPHPELVNDRSQGVQSATIQRLADYWASDYDWRTCESKLNALPQFKTEIDGVDIHFIHVRSPHPGALPLIMTHGWPGSVVELLDVVGPLTDPTAHGGQAEDAFDLVVPSLPGYGFSGEPTEIGWNPGRVALAWAELMHRLGYTRYVAQGGDVGASVTDAMGRQAVDGLAGIHTNLLVTALGNTAHAGEPHREGTRGARRPRHLPDERQRLLPGAGHAAADDRVRPAGLACRPGRLDARPRHGQLPEDLPRLRRRPAVGQPHPRQHRGQHHAVLADAAPARPRPGRTGRADGPRRPRLARPPPQVPVPVGFTTFPDEIFQAPRSWVEQAYPTLTYFNEADRGGHFAAWEEPELFASEVRAAFRSLR